MSDRLGETCPFCGSLAPSFGGPAPAGDSAIRACPECGSERHGLRSRTIADPAPVKFGASTMISVPLNRLADPLEDIATAVRVTGAPILVWIQMGSPELQYGPAWPSQQGLLQFAERLRVCGVHLRRLTFGGPIEVEVWGCWLGAAADHPAAPLEGSDDWFDHHLAGELLSGQLSAAIFLDHRLPERLVLLARQNHTWPIAVCLASAAAWKPLDAHWKSRNEELRGEVEALAEARDWWKELHDKTLSDYEAVVEARDWWREQYEAERLRRGTE